MCIRVIPILAVAVILSSPLTASAQSYQTTGANQSRSTSVLSPQERIARAKATFERQLAMDAKKQVRVLASFGREMEPGEVVRHARALGLRVEGFRHADAAGSGAYLMKPGESVEQALEAYDRDHRMFAERQMAELQLAIARAEDTHSKELLRAEYGRLGERMNKLSTATMKIVGADLSGPAQSLSEFSKAHKYVRVVEINEGTRINAAIRPQD